MIHRHPQSLPLFHMLFSPHYQSLSYTMCDGRKSSLAIKIFYDQKEE